MARTRAVVLGGKGFNVPKQLFRYFDVVKHFHQDHSQRISGMPECDIILVIRDYIHHAAIEQASLLAPGVPIVAARAGWSHMYQELEKRKLLPALEEAAPGEPIAEEPEPLPELLLPTPIPVEEQISDAELDRLTAPQPPPPPAPKLSEVAEPLRLIVPNPLPDKDDRIKTLASLFKDTNGELTPEIRDLYMERYKESLPGPIAAAARRMAGILPTPRNPVERVARNPVIQEMLIQYANVDKLVERRNEILAEIESMQRELGDVDRELEVYKPIIAVLDNLKKAQVKVKQDLEQQALKKRLVM